MSLGYTSPIRHMPYPNHLIYLQQLVSPSVLLQRVFNSLHHCDHLFLLEPSANDLNANRQTSHLRGVIVLVCPSRHPIQFLDVKGSRELV